MIELIMVLFACALASQEANQDPIDLAFLAVAHGRQDDSRSHAQAGPRAISGLVVSALKSVDSSSACCTVARLASTLGKAFESRASSNRAVA